MEEAEADQEHLEMVKMQHGMEAEAEEAALDIGSARYGNGGAGYQGVIYVRIPYEQ